MNRTKPRHCAPADTPTSVGGTDACCPGSGRAAGAVRKAREGVIGRVRRVERAVRFIRVRRG